MSQPERVEIAGSENLAIAGGLWRSSVAEPPKGWVLLLHGGGQTRHSWAATGTRLQSQGWNVLATDARGHGDSGWAEKPDGYGLRAFVADVEATVAWIAEPPVVLGASLGGSAALVAEGENPGLLRALVLVDVTPTLDPEGVAKVTAFMRTGLAGFDSVEAAGAAVAAYNPYRAQPEDLTGLRRNLRAGNDGRWYWHWDPAFRTSHPAEADRGVSAEARRSAASRIRIPTLLVRGMRSDIVSRQAAMELLDLVAGARFVEVAQAGHMVAGDDNDVFTGEVEAFLAGLPPLVHVGDAQ